MRAVLPTVLAALALLAPLRPASAQGGSPNGGGLDPQVLGAELAGLGGAAFDRGYLTLAVARYDAVAASAEALAKHADASALRKVGAAQADAARRGGDIAQKALKTLGGPDLGLLKRAGRGLGGFAAGLLGTDDARRSDRELHERLLGARATLLGANALAVTRAGDPTVLKAARDLLKLESDAYVALRLAALR